MLRSSDSVSQGCPRGRRKRKRKRRRRKGASDPRRTDRPGPGVRLGASPPGPGTMPANPGQGRQNSPEIEAGTPARGPGHLRGSLQSNSRGSLRGSEPQSTLQQTTAVRRTPNAGGDNSLAIARGLVATATVLELPPMASSQTATSCLCTGCHASGRSGASVGRGTCFHVAGQADRGRHLTASTRRGPDGAHGGPPRPARGTPGLTS